MGRRKSRRRRPAIAAICVVLLGAALTYGIYFKLPDEPALPGTLSKESLQWGGHERQFTVYRPAKKVARPALVFAMHGSGGDAAQARVMFGFTFEELAEQHGFIVVYPDGYERHFNGCRKAGPYAANLQKIDDVGFFRAMVDHVDRSSGVNREQVFATGVSNGGQMALRLALEAPDLVAAVAPIATALPTPDNMDCTASGVPVSILFMNGTSDPMNPYAGGKVALYGLLGDRGSVLSTTDSVRYWAELAGYTKQPAVRNLPDRVPEDGSTVTVTYWQDKNRSQVLLYTVHGGGHNAPHSAIHLPRLLGGSNNDIDAARELWAFFEQSVASPTMPR